tara:strand:+ start:218 stop:1273 length:1056 start_codon:yes stop_codon:yes gene_type:complete
MAKKVSIVLLNFNNEHDTNKCLDSLVGHDYSNFEVIVVENGSKIGHVDRLKKHIEKLGKKLDITLVEETDNMGFAEGNNIGVRKAKGEYVVLLNNDTIVKKGYLKSMVEKLESDDKIAIVGSRINNIGEFYGNVETLGNVISLMGEPVNVNIKDCEKIDQDDFTFMASGCSMMFRKDVLPEPFDGDYFIYGEDTYAAWLARLKGYDVKIAPESRLDHLGGQVRVKASNLLEFHGEKNKIVNPLIFYSGWNVLKMVPLILVNMLLTLVVSTVKLRVHIRLKSYLYLVTHFGKIMEKRAGIQKQRKVSDKKIAPYITYKIPQNFGFVSSIVNGLLFVYCFIVRLPVKEIYTQK